MQNYHIFIHYWQYFRELNTVDHSILYILQQIKKVIVKTKMIYNDNEKYHCYLFNWLFLQKSLGMPKKISSTNGQAIKRGGEGEGGGRPGE